MGGRAEPKPKRSVKQSSSSSLYKQIILSHLPVGCQCRGSTMRPLAGNSSSSSLAMCRIEWMGSVIARHGRRQVICDGQGLSAIAYHKVEIRNGDPSNAADAMPFKGLSVRCTLR